MNVIHQFIYFSTIQLILLFTFWILVIQKIYVNISLTVRVLKYLNIFLKFKTCTYMYIHFFFFETKTKHKINCLWELIIIWFFKHIQSFEYPIVGLYTIVWLDLSNVRLKINICIQPCLSKPFLVTSFLKEQVRNRIL